VGAAGGGSAVAAVRTSSDVAEGIREFFDVALLDLPISFVV